LCAGVKISCMPPFTRIDTQEDESYVVAIGTLTGDYPQAMSLGPTEK